MSLIRLNKRPAAQDLRIFGICCTVFAAIYGVLAWRKGSHEIAAVTWSVGTLAGLFVGLSPGLLRPAYLAAIYVSFPIGFVVAHVVLAVVYFAVVTPIGLLLRLFRNDPLSRSPVPGLATYWQKRMAPKPKQSYFRQS